MTATKDEVAQLIVGEAKRRGHTRDECLAGMSALYQESGWVENVWDPTHTTYGIAQQDASYPRRSDGAKAQIVAFFDKLDVKRTAPGHGDIWLNICWLQQAPNWPSAQYWYENGRRAYLTEIKSRIATVTPYLDKYWPTTGGTTVPDNRPAFNEFPIWSASAQGRHGAKIDAFFLHTQEGGGGDAAAEDLARYLGNPVNLVSYHYTVSQASDGGVTVVDVVDTDNASWSVLSANNRSINLCFAGARASWTREQWMKQANAIDVAAYLAVQDCHKYGIPTNVVAPPYTGRIPGISDHRYVTEVLRDGTHTDVGDNFPWDVFTGAVKKYAAEPTAPTSPAPKSGPVGPADDQLTMRWNCLGGQTLVEAVAQIRDKALGTNDRGKPGAI
ncbi:N-acetylmuramoyl-L-alanine amidase [Mycobacteroides chelonae]|uniref:peptidoglycan recognition protein family protein n=1 Tax=Mycobacteroides chelonae TaxID=1774 RepID=UPI0008A94B7A|nr:N-acetylmuramoyl-L-alanine amidase [Mycobacteroides chelonae]OHU23387.1 N-acetylmuramoyl-L-alanine amidase [Mycobacteroides chelonae]